MSEFCFNRCFRESSLRNYKKNSALCFTLIHTFFRRKCRTGLKFDFVVQVLLNTKSSSTSFKLGYDPVPYSVACDLCFTIKSCVPKYKGHI